MPHDTALIGTLAVCLGLAFLFGYAATRLRLPPIVGYLLAGMAVGPFTPGVQADAGLAGQLAEVGVILLMFGVGLHFSVRDLLAARRLAAPGALAQLALTTTLGAVLARTVWGWPWLGGVVLGLALAVASTVVLLRTLEDRGRLAAPEGRLAVSWVVTEDVVTVLALVLLPALAASGDAGRSLPAALGRTLLEVGLFVALMLFAGTRALPWILDRVARTGSRELFTLGVLAVALGIAVGAAWLFHVSFALGAFLAGVVISESELSHQAAAEALPLQDAFAVLFFVAAGMLVDPRVFVERPLAVAGLVAIVTCWKPLAVAGLARLLGAPGTVALPLGGSLAQVGEFSFVLTGLGVSLGVLPDEGRRLLLAAALVAIPASRGVAWVGDALAARGAARQARRQDARDRSPDAPPIPVEGARGDAPFADHVVLVGFGRVGATIGEALARAGVPAVVVERDRHAADLARRLGLGVVWGDAARAAVLGATGIARARLLVVATPEPFMARQVVRLARAANADLMIVARTHTAAEQQRLEAGGVGLAMLGERELAYAMAHAALTGVGRDDDEADLTVTALRDGERAGGPTGERLAEHPGVTLARQR